MPGGHRLTHQQKAAQQSAVYLWAHSSDEDFAHFANLCDDPGVLGRHLMGLVSSGKYKASARIEAMRRRAPPLC